MNKTAEMEINVSGGRIFDAKVMPNGTCKLSVEVEADESLSLIVPIRKITVPIHPKELECRIDPLAFQLDADWLQYEPRTDSQKQTKDLFLAGRKEGNLHGD